MTSRPRRVTRVLGYGLMAAGGMAAIAWPAPSVRSAITGSVLLYMWAGFLAGGGLFCTIGSALDRWIGEYAGLPLLVVTFLIFGLSAATTGRLSSIAGACVLTAIAALLAARWRDVSTVRREAARYVEHDRR